MSRIKPSLRGRPQASEESSAGDRLPCTGEVLLSQAWFKTRQRSKNSTCSGRLSWVVGPQTTRQQIGLKAQVASHRLESGAEEVHTESHPCSQTVWLCQSEALISHLEVTVTGAGLCHPPQAVSLRSLQSQRQPELALASSQYICSVAL